MSNRSGLKFRHIRIIILLSILLVVAIGTYVQQRATADWDKPLYLTLYPVNGDNTAAVSRYINELDPVQFSSIGRFIQEEASAYSESLKPDLVIEIGESIPESPPTPPDQHVGWLKIAAWSLKLRYWLFQNTGSIGLSTRHIRIFVIYHEALSNRVLAHSYGLQKGLIGVVHGFANSNRNKQNNVVIVHEMLHTLGATDKYGQGGYPVFPDGFAEPGQRPLLPQRWAEIMAGRIPVDRRSAVMPGSLDQCIIGESTAREINWLK